MAMLELLVGSARTLIIAATVCEPCPFSGSEGLHHIEHRALLGFRWTDRRASMADCDAMTAFDSLEVGIVGGGPAGLYSAILLKKAARGANITVVEKNPRGVTWGWTIST